MSRPGIDLGDPTVLLRPDVVADPRAFYDRLRQDAPVWQVPGQDTFLVSDPALIREAVGRPDELSSNLVSLVHDDGHGCPVPFRLTNPGDPVHVLATADPPAHTRHRKLLRPHLSPAAVAALEPLAVRLVDEALASVQVGAGTVDLVPVFTDAVPARFVAELIGLPALDVPEIVELVAVTGAMLDGVHDAAQFGPSGGAALTLAALVEARLRESLAGPAGERRGLFAVFAAGIEAGTVSVDEVRDMLVILVSAGSETTSSLIATTVERLARERDLQDRVRDDPAAIPAVLEDVLRTDGPFQFHYRYAVRETRLGATTIPEGSRVLLMWAAADRPGPVEADADDAEPGADAGPATHFAFGKGLHFCIGAPVARLEARVAIERLLARTGSIVLDPRDPPRRRPSIFLRRHAALPVVLA